MTHLIDKDALTAEIKRRYKLVDKYETNEFCAVASRDELVHLMNFINTLEVKEADLNLEIALWANAIPEIRLDDVERLAKYFFELGLKAQKGEEYDRRTETKVY